MFKSLFKKNNNEEIFAHALGAVVKIEDVPDPIFSEKMMGEGIAIMPYSGTVVSPSDGEIIQIAETKHAFALRTKLGQELLVHIGLETVKLKGEGFNVLVKLGDKVVKGQPIVEVDLNFIKRNASSTIIPMVITNSADGRFDFQWEKIKEAKAGETKVFTAKLK